MARPRARTRHVDDGATAFTLDGPDAGKDTLRTPSSLTLLDETAALTTSPPDAPSEAYDATLAPVRQVRESRPLIPAEARVREARAQTRLFDEVSFAAADDLEASTEVSTLRASRVATRPPTRPSAPPSAPPSGATDPRWALINSHEQTQPGLVRARLLGAQGATMPPAAPSPKPPAGQAPDARWLVAGAVVIGAAVLAVLVIAISNAAR